MSYLAIARKWRPTTFDEIAGQRHVTHTLRNAIRMGRIHHAFLFTGPRGVGKTTAARALARALNCVDGPTENPCGTCALCTAILSGTAQDVIEIDGASNNSVDDVRELREGVRYLPSQGRYRIYIIDEVHMLTKGAFNALLKTLEEPPPHVVFIFATTESQKIPETILSRVQRFDFKRIPGSVVVERLRTICNAESVKVSDYALRLIARSGEGSMRDAQSLLDQVISFGGEALQDEQVVDLLGLVDRGLLYQMLEGLIQGDAGRCLDAIAHVHEHGFELSQFTDELLELLRNATLVGLSPDCHRFLDVSDEEMKRLEALSKGVGPEVFTRWFDALLEVHDQVARAARPRLVLEMAVARLATIRPSRGLDHVVRQLDDLDRRLRAKGVAPGGRPGPALQAEYRPPEAPRPPQRDAPPPASVPVSTAQLFHSPRETSAPPKPAAGKTDDADPEPRRAQGVAPAIPVPSPAPPAVPQVSEPSHSEPDPAETWNRFLDALDPEDPRLDALVEHSALDSFRAGVLVVFFPSGFMLKQGREILQNADFLGRLRVAFPALGRIESLLRPADLASRLTRTERREAARVARQAEFQRRAETHPVVVQLRQRLGAELGIVKPPRDEETIP